MKFIESRFKGVLRLLLGLTILLSLFAFFASGLFPPGICGEVLRHNKQENIDASPLIYSEVENMRELEHAVRVMRQNAIRDKGQNR